MKEIMIDLVEELRDYINSDFTPLQDRILNGELEEVLKEYDFLKEVDTKEK